MCSCRYLVWRAILPPDAPSWANFSAMVVLYGATFGGSAAILFVVDVVSRHVIADRPPGSGRRCRPLENGNDAGSHRLGCLETLADQWAALGWDIGVAGFLPPNMPPTGLSFSDVPACVRAASCSLVSSAAAALSRRCSPDGRPQDRNSWLIIGADVRRGTMSARGKGDPAIRVDTLERNYECRAGASWLWSW